MTQPIKIDIVSDVVCPWCAVGYKHLERALEELDGKVTANLEWHPFELNPHMAKEGEAINEHLMNKYGLNEAQLQENKQRLIDVGNQAGYEFNFENRSRIYNTFDCHKLLHWANEEGKQKELKLALMYAYFTEGKDVSNTDVLLDLVDSLGLSREKAQAVLQDKSVEASVREEQQKYMSMGINAVPAFVINEKYLISGGQPVEAFKQALTQIQAES